ncbi:molybdate transport system substrate-binding protein [Murinocardiopsis flavida]|uniref:Molybdate transport system substrate-binding protein n=1 Tax=Murinocardiopsis flavida TaxID=645275 RepID=A0A2P8CSX9_9ACTN|nr:molybdate ABC transporter substrate-binding protein [Murinocardiopsis flavida]PSK88073.1 molybdate transport system substrate-binding protein [Murinocardiopsis flavida]
MPRPRGARTQVIGAAIAAVGLLAAAACGQVEDGGQGGGSGGAETRTLTVFAAASLTESFTTLKKRFETDNPGVTVEFNFGGSSELAQQINEGAPADVFASANPANMDLVADEGDAEGEPTVFAQNTLEIAVPPDNPADIQELDDLAAENTKVALCAAEVPCGSAAEKVMAETGVEITPVTEEEDVKAAMTKVELGEVDAALVYKTDVIAAGDKVKGIAFPESEHAVNDYPIAPLKDAPEADLAAEWIALTTSDTGTKVLTDAGFRAP